MSSFTHQRPRAGRRWPGLAVAAAAAAGAVVAVAQPAIPAAAIVGQHPDMPFVSTTQPTVTKNDFGYSTVIPGVFDSGGRAGVATIGAQLINSAVINSDNAGGFTTPAGSGANIGDTSWGFGSSFLSSGQPLVDGDFNGDHLTDIAVLFPGSLNTGARIGFSTGTGSFRGVNANLGSIDGWLAVHGAHAVAGDFDGDGRTDIALVGGDGWTSIPVAFSNGDGTFRVTNTGQWDFASWATSTTAKTLFGDFNGDGRTDIMLIGDPNWTTIPVAFSNGDGSFRVTNTGQWDFASWATSTTAKTLTRDFNGDGRTDIMLIGDPNWTTIPVAFSNGDGSFRVTNAGQWDFAFWASNRRSAPIPGDFDGDGKQDVALLNNDENSGWHTIPVAFSQGDGTFTVTNVDVPNFPLWSRDFDARAFAEDLNGDGKTDIALTGGDTWFTVPVARSVGNGAFTVTNPAAGAFPNDTKANGTNGGTTVPPPPTPYTATLTMTKQQVVSGFIPYLGQYPPLGSVPPFHLISIRFPASGFIDETALLVKPGHSTTECGNADAVIALTEGQALTSAQIATLYGSTAPHFDTLHPLVSVACHAGPIIPGFFNLELTIQND